MNAATGIDPEYMTARALATYSGLGVRTLRRYFTHPAHPLPVYRIGGKVLVKRADYDAWALQFKCASPPLVGAMLERMLNGR